MAWIVAVARAVARKYNDRGWDGAVGEAGAGVEAGAPGAAEAGGKVSLGLA